MKTHLQEREVGSILFYRYASFALFHMTINELMGKRTEARAKVAREKRYHR